MRFSTRRARIRRSTDRPYHDPEPSGQNGDRPLPPFRLPYGPRPHGPPYGMGGGALTGATRREKLGYD
ncbi:hypothetical protein Plo01_14460 [Planobispora longispora]|uniref:Uncharacterized protein n=1 Tax=Planobispora longispora TaxID=28887 RepID=A0A8J3W3P7_9ACTN|nr:hypothetical protein GCM10020093_079730 [Planobispora longispora]GIH75017.1 hypothetical protein Plo01_14460 [Planobispora longispora]